MSRVFAFSRMRSCTRFDTLSCKSCCTILLSELNRLESRATPNCRPTGNQIGFELWMRIPITTLSITRPVIQTLRAGVKPCNRLRTPMSAVNSALVDQTRRRTRGKLVNAPITCLTPIFSFDLLCFALSLSLVCIRISCLIRYLPFLDALFGGSIKFADETWQITTDHPVDMIAQRKSTIKLMYTSSIDYRRKCF